MHVRGADRLTELQDRGEAPAQISTAMPMHADRDNAMRRKNRAAWFVPKAVICKQECLLMQDE